MPAKIRFAHLIVTVLLIAVSSAQLSSDKNLWLYNSNNNLPSTFLNVIVDKDITSDEGMSIQLTCICPSASPLSIQQFFFSMPPPFESLVAVINTWSGTDPDPQIDAIFPVISNLPTAGIIPAGWNLMIQLNNDGNGDVTSVESAVTDSSSNSPIGTSTVDITQLTTVSGSSASLSPIYGYTVNIVGFANQASTTFSSGSGTIVYDSNIQLETDSELPLGSIFPNGTEPESGETSNMEYDGSIMQEDGSAIYTQTFSVPNS